MNYHTETSGSLLEMLTYARPHGSKDEALFVDRFINPLPGIAYDKFGNGIVNVGNAPVLWSSHTDTVHHASGRQSIDINQLGQIHLVNGKRGQCLGADDAAGVWLMCEMIAAKVPGRYIFHAGEECAGLGSSYIVKNRKDLFDGIDFAIAFDRKGTADIITHQMGARCCSDTFADALAAKLGMGHRADATGLFTDTANYVDHIAECTNVSVGYEGAHSHLETLSFQYITALRDRLIHFDPSGLQPTRRAGELDPSDYLGSQWERDLDWMPGRGGGKSIVRKNAAARVFDLTLVELCEDYPEAAAELLEQLGMDASDLSAVIRDLGYSI